MKLEKILKSHPAIFVCGTDTGVGKTVVTGALCAYLNSKGIRAGAFKPLESGCKVQGGRHLKRADSEFLKRAAGMPEPLDRINPYFFKEALAPGIAAERERQFISLKKIQAHLKYLQKIYRPVLIEGAGGLLAAVCHLQTNLDLIKRFKAPVLIVSRLGLGALNHTLLTWEHLKRHRIPVLGVVLNAQTLPKTLAEKTNPSVLKRYHLPFIGVFPHLRSKSVRALALAASKITD